MPPKTKKFFTRHNSVKFMLITEGRDESGEKIKQNVLVPVPNNHIPENSQLFSSLAGVCAPTNDDPSEIEANNDEADQAEPTFIKYDELTSNQEADLENVLNQLEEDGEIDFDDLREQMDEMSFFDNPNSYLQGCSNMRVEMIDEENSLLDGFSDSEFGDDYGNSSAKPKFASIKQDCPENIKLLDEAFKRYMKEKYNENCIGALDDKEINDATTEESEDLKLYVLKSVKSKPFVLTDCDNDLKEKVKQYAEVEQPEKLVKVVTKKPVEFDCESILSTYSNIHNHPTVIKEQSKIRKIRIPNNPLKKKISLKAC
ncbi:protein LTV1 homolog [Caerostris extrusa]|uniref:Protein LTV1 homolog n=1 Tax=Caerostris extrusa TaxID=172846 RepID=A0AAV4QAG2_CAEEX|nr:protein LTV1 homolog [Caerostris extrusa]